MTCPEVEAVLAAFADGELRGDEMRHVARHLATCPGCEAASARLERLQQAVRSAVLEATGESDTRAVWAALAPRLAATAPWRWSWLVGMVKRPLQGALPVPVWVGGAAAAVLLAGALLWTGGWRYPGEADAPPTLAQARIDSLEAPGNVRVWNRADSGTLVIWIEDDGAMNVERLDP